MAPPSLPHGIQEPLEPDVQPAEEADVEQDNDDENKEAEQPEHGQFNNRIVWQSKQRADSLENLNLESFLENKHLIFNQFLNVHGQRNVQKSKNKSTTRMNCRSELTKSTVEQNNARTGEIKFSTKAR